MNDMANEKISRIYGVMNDLANVMNDMAFSWEKKTIAIGTVSLQVNIWGRWDPAGAKNIQLIL